jgi:hypothetical protein
VLVGLEELGLSPQLQLDDVKVSTIPIDLEDEPDRMMDVL